MGDRREAPRTVPGTSTFVPRNPDRRVEIGGDSIAYATVLGPPNCSAIESDFVRLAQFFNIIHVLAGSPVEPMDVPVVVLHLESTKAVLTLSDKVP